MQRLLLAHLKRKDQQRLLKRRRHNLWAFHHKARLHSRALEHRIRHHLLQVQHHRCHQNKETRKTKSAKQCLASTQPSILTLATMKKRMPPLVELNLRHPLHRQQQEHRRQQKESALTKLL